MTFHISRLWRLALLFGLLPVFSTPRTTSAETFADPAFRAVWQRTDQLVQAGQADRAWLWGRAPAASRSEPYAESPGGKRLVQYFDKSRMEITDPRRPKNEWYVSNGLIVREMALGRIQVGDNKFVAKRSPLIPVAGDLVNNPGVPTYAALGIGLPELAPGRHHGPLQGEPEAWLGAMPLTQKYPETRFAYYDDVTRLNVPGVFWRFLHQEGSVLEQGRAVRAAPIFDWQYVAGHPITDAYWTRAVVGGQEKDVLLQLFERRVLTFTPSNPRGMQVEMGNVGQHYFQWRYGPEVADKPGRCARPANLPLNKVAQVGPGYCLVWLDEFNDERGFRIVINYGERERFTYQVAPNTTEFIVPPAEAPRFDPPACRRADFSLSIYALRPSGEALVGGFATDSECGAVRSSAQ